MSARRFGAATLWLLVTTIGAPTLAQPPELAGPSPPQGTVQWRVSLPATGLKAGATAVLELSGEIQEGWHVYALTQPSGGPTALRITVDDNEIAQTSGTASGTTPRKRRDPSFGLETQFYTHTFTVRLPVLLKQQAATGKQLIPVSVRFQMCSDRECQPPTTAHLSVPVEILPSGV